MANHKIRVNPNFRGELILPTLPYTLKGGQLVTINEKEFNSVDIKMALGKKFIIDETDVEALIDADISLEEEELDTEPNLVDDIDDDDDEEQGDIDPRQFETKSNPGVWDPDSNSLLDAKEGARKTIDQLTGAEMDVQTGGKVKFEDKPNARKKNRPQGKKKISNLIEEARKEVADAAKGNTLPVPNVGDIEMVYENGSDDIMFVDKEQEKEKILKRKAQVKQTKTEETEQPVKRKRGRPRKSESETTTKTAKKTAKKRGRPRKTPVNNEEVS